MASHALALAHSFSLHNHSQTHKDKRLFCFTLRNEGPLAPLACFSSHRFVTIFFVDSVFPTSPLQPQRCSPSILSLFAKRIFRTSDCRIIRNEERRCRELDSSCDHSLSGWKSSGCQIEWCRNDSLVLFQ